MVIKFKSYLLFLSTLLMVFGAIEASSGFRNVLRLGKMATFARSPINLPLRAFSDEVIKASSEGNKGDVVEKGFLWPVRLRIVSGSLDKPEYKIGDPKNDFIITVSKELNNLLQGIQKPQ